MSAEPWDIVVCGSLHLDILVKGGSLPRLDETAVGSSWEMVCGGKGGNQAGIAAGLGARTAMIGRIGQDAFGRRLKDNLKASGVDVTSIGDDPDVGSGMSVAILDRSGGYGAVIVSGANLRIEPETAANALRALGAARLLILQNEVPEPVNLAVARAARELGTIVICNAAPARAMSPAFLDLIDVLVVNRVEAEILAGMPNLTVDTAETALGVLAGPGRSVVITLGGDGLVLKPHDGPIVRVAPIKVDVVSTHGAGDCFIGALALNWLRTGDLVAAAHAANRIAAGFVSKPRPPSQDQERP